jgi:hypothetical protein
MVAVPAATPVTIPVEPTVAIVVLLLLHVPALVASAKPVVNPVHTTFVPVIAAGNGFTVTVAVTLPQPVV